MKVLTIEMKTLFRLVLQQRSKGSITRMIAPSLLRTIQTNDNHATGQTFFTPQ